MRTFILLVMLALPARAPDLTVEQQADEAMDRAEAAMRSMPDATPAEIQRMYDKMGW